MPRGPLRKRESYLWKRDPLDWYVEPDWCSQRLFDLVEFEGLIWDCCAGTGRIAEAARAAGYDARASDIEPRGHPVNFLDIKVCFAMTEPCVANIVSNPPYKLALEVTQFALKVALFKVAMFLPANWVQGEKRSRWLESTPLRQVLFVCPRPSCPPGDIIRQGVVPGNGTTDYAWFIWDRTYSGTPQLGWCRRGDDKH